MKRWFRRILIAAALAVVAGGIFYESATHVGRGWLGREPFYDGRPASYWASEIERWETKDPEWRTYRRYERTSASPRWLQPHLPESAWPRLLDGDPEGLPVLQWLSSQSSTDLQDWARIGMERIDNTERGPCKFARHDVGFMAQVFEVDEAFHEAVKGKWHSLDDLEELEQKFLAGAEAKPSGESPFDRVKKQVLLKRIEEFKVKDGGEGLLYSATRTTKRLPTPTQIRLGRNEPQIIEEGVNLRVQVSIYSGGRFVRVKFIEKIVELEGVDPIRVLLDNDGREGKAEIVSVKQTEISLPRNIPDGGTILVPLQYRSADAKQKGRWLVIQVTPRIYIEEEERHIRGLTGK